MTELCVSWFSGFVGAAVIFGLAYLTRDKSAYERGYEDGYDRAIYERTNGLNRSRVPKPHEVINP